MTASRDPERLIRAFLDEGEERLGDPIYEAVRAGIEQKRQRAFIGPWRTPIMNKLVTFGFGAAAVAVVGLFLGYQLLGSPRNVGGPGNPTPTPDATATPVPTPTPRPAPPLNQSFASTLHGYSVSYPEGWTTEAATEAWTGTQPNFGDAPADFLYDPSLNDHLFVSIASRSIGDASAAGWAAEEITLFECTASEPTTVDGASGLIGSDDCNVAAVTMDGRGYVFALYTSGDEAWIARTYNRAWFAGLLATVQLHPGDAVD